MGELMKIEDQPVSLLQAVVRAAQDPSVDVAKMERLIELKRQVDADAARAEFFQAMSRVQPAMPQISKDGTILVNNQVRSRFSTYEHLDRIIRPIYGAEGFSIDWNTAEAGQEIRVLATLMHRAGHHREYSVILPPDTSGAKSSIQARASTISQGRRMLTKMMFNIIETTADPVEDGLNEPITEADIAALKSLAKSCPGDYDKNMTAFLNWLKVDQLSDLTKRDLGKAKQALAQKARASK